MTHDAGRSAGRPAARIATRTMQALAGLAMSTALGLGALAWATSGFRALTYDGARAAAIADAPRPVPPSRVTSVDGRPAALLTPGMVHLVDFVSTSCTTMCLAQGVAFAALQDSLVRRAAAGTRPAVRLVSVSFDPDDDAARLAGFATRLGAHSAWWEVHAVTPADRRRLLETFGIVVVRDPVAGWRHNAAFHVVDAQGSLVRVVPSDAPVDALRHALALATGPLP